METTNTQSEAPKPVLSPAQQTHRSSAVTALVLGITSVVLFLMPVINLAALAVGIVGLVKARKNRAYAAVNDIKEDSMNSAGYVCSICGIVLSALSVVFSIIMLFVVLFLVSAAATTLPVVLPEITDMLPEIEGMVGDIVTALPRLTL